MQILKNAINYKDFPESLSPSQSFKSFKKVTLTIKRSVISYKTGYTVTSNQKWVTVKYSIQLYRLRCTNNYKFFFVIKEQSKSGVSFGDCMTDEFFVHQQNEKDKEIKLSKDKEIDLSKEKEIELLKKQLKLMAEKNVHLETSLDEEKVKNRDLQQEIDHVNATSTAKLKVVEDSLYNKTNQVEFLKKEASTTSSKLKSLEDSLSRKTNEVDHLNKQMDIQAKDHQACKKELIATKNQLFYKHLALDGVCLLYTSPSPRDGLLSRMPSSA